MTMVDDRSEPRRFLHWLPVYLLVSFVLYVLSAGPLYWVIYKAFVIDQGSLIAELYLPLVRMSRKFGPLGTFVEWYVGLWVL